MRVKMSKIKKVVVVEFFGGFNNNLKKFHSFHLENK
jgi:hypothetical protein